MEKNEVVINDEFRMKVINFLKIYGYYDGILANREIEKKYVGGELVLSDVISSSKEFKKLKMSVLAVMDYCRDNYYDQISSVIKVFYRNECLEVRKKFGNFFDRL